MRAAPDPRPDALDRAAVQAEMEQARLDFHRLLAQASRADLRRPSAGTRWTNQQMPFHMLFGFLVVRTLPPLARLFGHLPRTASRAFGGLLDSARTSFHLINYLGSCAGARIIPPAHMAGVVDRVTAALQRRLQQKPDTTLGRGMHYPTTWDPLFTRYMTLADLYRYPTRHYRHHRQQLTLP
jgi:hypothetical protein